jgi:hypothetical protein
MSLTALKRTLVESSGLFTKRRCKAAIQPGADLVAALASISPAGPVIGTIDVRRIDHPS